MTSCLVTLAFSSLLGLPAGSVAQSAELPLVLQSEHRPPLSVADNFFLIKNADELLKCRLTYKNDVDEKTVQLDWYARRGKAEGYGEQTVETEFFPTALCVAAGLTDTIFVAGATPATATMVIEQWTLGPAVLTPPAVGSLPAGAEPRLELVLPSITRTVVYSASTSVTQEVIAMAFHSRGNELLFLEHASRSLYSLSMDAAQSRPTSMANAKSLPFLGNVRSMQANMHGTGGFVVFFFEHPTWAYRSVATELGILRDSNLDGQLEVDAAAWITMAELDVSFPTGGWIEAYP